MLIHVGLCCSVYLRMNLKSFTLSFRGPGFKSRAQRPANLAEELDGFFCLKTDFTGDMPRNGPLPVPST
jgi:hypothetical protein